MAADRRFERFAVVETAARESPMARVRREGAAPQQRLQHTVAHLQDDRDRLVGRSGIVLRGRFSLHSRKLAEGSG